jgi:sulfite dehydrogenase (quinone) subunit SoeC
LSYGTAFVLITAGLISSTLHLGRPERAWRAMSEWRTSWLSREAVMAIVTYPIAGLLGLIWFTSNTASPVATILALATVVCAVITLWCTGMIYASLPTVRAWHMPVVAPLYVGLGLATGGIVFNLIGILLTGRQSHFATLLGLIALGISYVVKTNYWRSIDSAARTYTAGAATGLGKFGTVRTLDPPHAKSNYVMKEMGYQVARKHALKLRSITELTLFAIPAACLSLSAFAPLALATVLAVVAVLASAVGILMERWLFFAEAEHVVVLYYGKQVG